MLLSIFDWCLLKWKPFSLLCDLCGWFCLLLLNLEKSHVTKAICVWLQGKKLRKTFLEKLYFLYYSEVLIVWNAKSFLRSTTRNNCLQIYFVVLREKEKNVFSGWQCTQAWKSRMLTACVAAQPELEQICAHFLYDLFSFMCGYAIYGLYYIALLKLLQKLSR